MAIQFQPLSAGSGVVKIERKGTGVQAVPNSGLVEKLVFNTELTPTEVDNIISNANLTFVDFNSMPVYPIFVNEENSIGIIIINYGTLMGDGTVAYVIMEYGSELFIYCSSVISSLTSIDGWNYDLFTQLGGGNEFPVNMEANSTFNGLAVGSQNDAIKDIINVGGVEPYLKELKGTYEPIDIEITENTTIDLATQYMDNKQMPVSLNIQTTSGTLDITTNGEHDVSKYEKANVNVQPNLQYKSLSLTSTSLTINPDSGYDGLSQVRVDVTSNIDSDIKAENIKKGVNILGVSGSYTGDLLDITNNYMTEIPQECYKGFKNIQSFNAPNVTKIGDSAFESCTNLTSFTFNDNITEIGDSAFESCDLSALEELTIPPLITELASNSFSYINTKKINTNNVVILGKGLTNCNSEEIVLPKAKQLDVTNGDLSMCFKLKKVDLYVCEEIGGGAFSLDFELNTLIIRTTSKVCTLLDTSGTFNNTLIANGTGILYVPDSLVASYKADTSWQSALPNYNTQIKPLSEYVEA